MSTLREVQKSLIDDLRAATEFYNATGDRAQPETKEAAREWLANAALNIGKALIAQDAASEAPHA
jgi:hypothetical protein